MVFYLTNRPHHVEGLNALAQRRYKRLLDCYNSYDCGEFSGAAAAESASTNFEKLTSELWQSIHKHVYKYTDKMNTMITALITDNKLKEKAEKRQYYGTFKTQYFFKTKIVTKKSSLTISYTTRLE